MMGNKNGRELPLLSFLPPTTPHSLSEMGFRVLRLLPLPHLPPAPVGPEPQHQSRPPNPRSPTPADPSVLGQEWMQEWGAGSPEHQL